MEASKVIESLEDLIETLKEEVDSRSVVSRKELKENRKTFDIDAMVLYNIAEILSVRLGYPVDFCLEVLQDKKLNLEVFYED